MKKFLFILMSVMMLLCSCHEKLTSMTRTDNGEYTSIVWDDKTYIPFCVVSKSDCGKKIGCINGDTDDIISLYKDLSPDEWLANYLTMDGGAMLYKEVNVTNIPDGLQSEYNITE
ncbi:MAG: hypothetical protein K2K66_07065 [Ruminococcus sp.]|nr:hypothetical protein [Ruminococcus sp.]